MNIGKAKKALTTIMACAVMCSMLFAPSAFAAPPVPAVPEIPNAVINGKALSGNTFEGGKEVFFRGAYDRDVYGTGATVTMADSQVASDALFAGKDISVSATQIGGSLRAAAMNIALASTTTQDNVTVACQTFTTDQDSAIEGTAIAFCQNASVAGKAGSVIIYGKEAYVDADVQGDVSITADSVSFGPNAKVAGHVEVNSKNEPLIDPDAQIEDMLYTHIEEEESGVDAAALAGLLGGFGILSLIFGIIGTAVCAILIELLLRRPTAGSARMAKERTAPMLVSGLVGGIAMPIALIIACCLVVTLPIAGATFFAMLGITVIAGAFAGASLAKIAFPKMHRILSALIGGGIIGIAGAIPVVGWIVSLCCVVYLLGYVIQSVYLGMKSDDAQTQAE